MPERTFSSPDYRYGFNGKEKDEDGEWGDLTHYDYGFRIYNPGIARFLSVDPLTPQYPMLTPYQYASNSPVWMIDIDGMEGDPYSLAKNRERIAERRKLMTAEELKADKEVESKVALGVSLWPIAVWGGIEAAPLAEGLFYRGAAKAALNAGKVTAIGEFTVGVFDEGNQVNFPGPIDDTGRGFIIGSKKIISEIVKGRGENEIVEVAKNILSNDVFKKRNC